MGVSAPRMEMFEEKNAGISGRVGRQMGALVEPYNRTIREPDLWVRTGLGNQYEHREHMNPSWSV